MLIYTNLNEIKEIQINWMLIKTIDTNPNEIKGTGNKQKNLGANLESTS